MRHRTTGALVAASLITLAACGSASDGAPATVVDTTLEASAEPAADDFSEADSAQDAATDEVAATNALPDEPADEPGASIVEVADSAPVTDAAPTEPAATDAPAPAEPVVGGRLFATDVQPAAQFDANPFPDLVVEDIGKDAQVNIRNILPSDRPVLLWAWAPH